MKKSIIIPVVSFGSKLKIKSLLSTLCMLFLSASSFGQEINELGTKLSAMDKSADAYIRNEAVYLKSLVSDLQPTLYLQNGKFKQTELQISKRINTDVSSLQLLNLQNPIYENAEIICIKIENENDLLATLNLSDLSGFKSLKYVYFLCTFNVCQGQYSPSECEVEKIAQIIKRNENPGYLVFYSVIIPI